MAPSSLFTMRQLRLIIISLLLLAGCKPTPVFDFTPASVVAFRQLSSVDKPTYEKWLRVYIQNCKGNVNAPLAQELGSALLEHSRNYDITFVIDAAVTSANDSIELEFMNRFVAESIARLQNLKSLEMPRLPVGDLEQQRSHCLVFWRMTVRKAPNKPGRTAETNSTEPKVNN